MAFCGSCGAPLPDENLKFCPRCGASTDGETPTPQNSIPVIEEVKYPMKWFKFLIYFGLFVGAIANAAFGVLYLTGFIYDISSGEEGVHELVYAFFSNLKTVDVVFGVLFIALAVFGIYTRFRLAGYKKNGPACLIATYAASAIISFAYMLIVCIILGDFSDSDFGSIVTSIAMIVLNYIYFKKRKSLFTK